MTVTNDARSLLDSILGYAKDEHAPTPPEDRPAKIGTVDPAFDPALAAAARVTFDGEATLTARAYPWLDEPPAAGSRVVLIPVGKSYVIAGPIGQLGAAPFRPFREAADVATIVALGVTLANGANAKANVVFPAGRFSQPPILSLVPSSARLNVAYESLTASGFTISADNRSGAGASGLITVHWTARQMTPTSGAG